jgi:dipeptidyl aminopeptidase/acylaminoacyl peptidase
MKRISILVLLSICATNSFAQQKDYNEELLLELNRVLSAKISPDGKKVLYEMQQMSITNNGGNVDLFVLEIASKKLVQLTNTPFSESNAGWDAKGLIWFMKPDGETSQIFSIDCFGKNETKRSSFTHDISGFTFSLDQSKVAVIQSVDVEESVKEKHQDMPKANMRLTDDLMYRHWNYYNSDARDHIFVYNVKDLQVAAMGIDINKGERTNGILPAFAGSESFCFNLDASKLFYSTKKLSGKDFAFSTNTDIYEFDFQTNQTKNISEKNLGYDNAPQLSPDGKYLAWQAMKTNGFESDKNDLIVLNLKDYSVQNLTATFDYTLDDFKWQSKSNGFYLILPTKGTKHVFELAMGNTILRQVSQGVFDVNSIDCQGTNLVVLRSSMVEPNDVYSLEHKKGKMTQLTDANQTKLEHTVKPKIEDRWVETSDGKKMLVWVVYPPNFDPNKKYPALLFCQGGPQSMVSQSFSYRWNIRLMASKGYIVVAPNRRGLPGFGQEWNDAISKDWGGQAMRDYLAAIDEVSNEPYVDVNRLGAVGASYGGYSTYFLAGCHEKRFKTFVSHCGLFNLESWYLTTEEMFFANHDIGGPFWKPENKELFAKNSPHNYLNKWDTPMLVIHGENDFRVPIGEGLQAFQACKIMGIKTRLLTFPSEGHWITKPQNGIVWYREFFEWLAADLKP